MSEYNEMLYGDLAGIASRLSGDNPPVVDAPMLSAILTNICNKCDGLHARIVKLEEARLDMRR